MGVALVDIEWEKYNDNNTTYGSKWETCPDEMVTTENQQVRVYTVKICWGKKTNKQKLNGASY